MVRLGLLMRSEGVANPQSRGPAVAALHAASGVQGDLALEDQCRRLQLLIGELLLKNQVLRSEVARLRGGSSMDVPADYSGEFA